MQSLSVKAGVLTSLKTFWCLRRMIHRKMTLIGVKVHNHQWAHQSSPLPRCPCGCRTGPGGWTSSCPWRKSLRRWRESCRIRGKGAIQLNLHAYSERLNNGASNSYQIKYICFLNAAEAVWKMAWWWLLFLWLSHLACILNQQIKNWMASIGRANQRRWRAIE